MTNLISMVDFVIEQDKINKIGWNNYVNLVSYANLLKQPLELWMFVPCDEDGNVLAEPPKNVDINNVDWQIEYQQAKERCLFEKSKYGMGTIKEILKCSKIIEDLITCSKLYLQLTQTALKLIGL